MSATRNFGISAPRGEFIDVDDVWRPGKLAEQVALLDAHPELGLVCGTVRYWSSWAGGVDEVIPTGHVLDRVVPPPDAVVNLYPLGPAGGAGMDVLVRREVVDSVGGFESHFTGMYEDQAFLAKVSCPGRCGSPAPCGWTTASTRTARSRRSPVQAATTSPAATSSTGSSRTSTPGRNPHRVLSGPRSPGLSGRSADRSCTSCRRSPGGPPAASSAHVPSVPFAGPSCAPAAGPSCRDHTGCSRGESADRRVTSEGGVAAGSVVVGQPAVQRGGALVVAGPGGGVGHSVRRGRLNRSALPLVQGLPGLVNRRPMFSRAQAVIQALPIR